MDLCLKVPLEDGFHNFSTHRVVFGGLELYPQQPIDPGAAAQRGYGLIQVLLSLQGQHQLRGKTHNSCTTAQHH